MGKTRLAAAVLLATTLAWAGAEAAVGNFRAALNAASEVPPTNSKGTGSATVTLDTTAKKLTWTITYSGLTGPVAAAHFHCPAGPNANAPVAIPIPGPYTSPVKGSATVTDPQMNQLQAGQCYINLHTAANKGGEIRGQVARAP